MSKLPLPRRAAVAAAVAASTLGLLLWLSLPRETLAHQLVAHAEGEPLSLVRTTVAVDQRRLDDILARSGIRLKRDAATVTYAMSCWFRGRYVPHLVVQGDQGPVTVLLLTQESGVNRREMFHEGGFQGVVLPAPRGALAVLAHGAEAERAAERLLQALEYLPRKKS